MTKEEHHRLITELGRRLFGLEIVDTTSDLRYRAYRDHPIYRRDKWVYNVPDYLALDGMVSVINAMYKRGWMVRIYNDHSHPEFWATFCCGPGLLGGNVHRITNEWDGEGETMPEAVAKAALAALDLEGSL